MKIRIWGLSICMNVLQITILIEI